MLMSIVISALIGGIIGLLGVQIFTWRKLTKENRQLRRDLAQKALLANSWRSAYFKLIIISGQKGE